MQPTELAAEHPFVETLRTWKDGIPVDCGPDWQWDVVEAAVAQGPHQSALTPESIALFQEDVEYQVKAGFCKIYSWNEVQRLKPPKLKISPVAVVPQRDRRGRIILDLSFPVRGMDQASVNETTCKESPPEPVKELGNVILRLFDFMAAVPSSEIIMFSKIDLSDGFWRMIVQEGAEWNFAYVLPGLPGDEIQLVVPSALQMGWTESPGYFCAATETARDIVQGLTESEKSLPPHEFERYMVPDRPAKRQRTTEGSWKTAHVFVDDYILGAVEDKTGTLLGRISRAALHGIHSVFPPPKTTGHVGGKDPISVKKLEKGDARWNPEKEILGFLMDGEARTVRLTQRKADDIDRELTQLLRKTRVPMKRFRSIVGRLRHAAIILPGAKGMFSPINKALRGEPKFISLGKSTEVRAAMLDLRTLVRDLATRPTHVRELLPGDDHYVGNCDACATGAGGVWYSGTIGVPPLVWRLNFPTSVSSQVVSEANPKGHLTNSDLELAGVLLHYSVLEEVLDNQMRHSRVGIFCDNTPAVYWTARMADKSQSATSGRLLRGLAMRQRNNHSGPMTVAHVAGDDNTMADVASRIYNTEFSGFDDGQFLTHFQQLFPLPQMLSWRVVKPPADMISAVTSTLLGTRLPMQRWIRKNKQRPGPTGAPMPPNANATRGSETSTMPSNNKCSLVSLLGSGQVTTVDSTKSTLAPWKKRSATFRRPSCWVEARQTPDDSVQKGPAKS